MGPGGIVVVVEVDGDLAISLSEADLEVKARTLVELGRLAARRWETMSTQKEILFIGNNTTTNIV